MLENVVFVHNCVLVATLSGDLLKFGTQAFALRKWWQDNHEEWGETRQPVLGAWTRCLQYADFHKLFCAVHRHGQITSSRPMSSPLTLRRRRRQFLENNKLMKVLLRRPIGADNAIYLPERDEVSRPAGMDLQPARRLRGKTKPAMLHRLMRAPIEGEDDPFEPLGRVNAPSWERDSDDSWTLENNSIT